MSVTRRSGRSSASGMPGSPAPLPTSATVPLAVISPFNAALLRMWRSHSLSASRGPSRPQVTPVDARMSTYLLKSGNWAP